MQISLQTYEEFFLLYTDGELNLDEKKAVEDFIIENPDLEEELILMQEATFSPDEQIIFGNKKSLYREEERKVIPLPWLKFAAAAILLIAFGIFGWLYSGEKNTVKTNTVASSNSVHEQGHPLKNAEPSDTAGIHMVPSPTETVNKQNMGTAPISRKSFVSLNTKKHKKNITLSEEKKELSAVGSSSTNKIPDHAMPVESVVKNNVKKEGIIIQVEGKQLAPNDILAVNQFAKEKLEYGESGDNDMIYFANTSIPKKSRLRGIFRKASRILDKVTSFQ